MEPKQKYDVFISYSRKDTTIANKICDALDKQGISYFIDRQGIGGGQEFPEVISEAIIGCRIMLYLASENSYNSKYTKKEITFAFNEKPDSSILPYIIDGSCLPTTQRFIFSSVNIRTLEEHPIDTILVRDLCQLLGREYREKARKKTEEEAKRKAEEKHKKRLKELENIELKPIIKNSKIGFADETGKVLIPCRWKMASYFIEGLAAVENVYEKWGYIDKTGKIVIPCKWQAVKEFSDGLARVMDKNYKWGYIDKTGKVVIPCKWKKAYPFFDGWDIAEDDKGNLWKIDRVRKIVVK